ncbi:hypothetical protein Goklo_007504 [Gossypium klotzschianum]|uniref:DUF7745 domain-containing protein n=1 Tax=Gossypium klotzschianum TaxID=34286 RepID=A0A7J8W3N2_9ROSI|nr:hypothetical protein [Gossypium klotzschianum]
MPIVAILAETFRSLNACKRTGEGRFIGCAQLLLAWFHSHFWKVEKFSYRVFSEDYSPLKEFVAIPRRDNISEEKCEDFDWVPLLMIWGVFGYDSLLVLRQYRLRQFIPATQGLAQLVQANILCLRYESESNQGQELAWLLRKVKAMSIRAMPYIIPISLKTHATFVPKLVDANAQYEYNAGIMGHSIKNCTAFKKLIERFIKMGLVRFDDPSRPNVVGNPLPNHSDQWVNAIIESGGKRTKTDVVEVKSH